MQEHLCSYMTTVREHEKFVKRVSHRLQTMISVNIS